MRPAAIVALACIGSTGCTTAMAPSAFADGRPAMRPERFFVGTTRSSGVVETAAGSPTRRFGVVGNGAASPDGTFGLTQVVSIDGEPPQTRTWSLRAVDAHRYVGTLTDASGDVEADAYGDLLHLRYPMKKPFGGAMEQWMYLQPDGVTVVNEATVRVFGVVVAHLSERITHER